MMLSKRQIEELEPAEIWKKIIQITQKSKFFYPKGSKNKINCIRKFLLSVDLSSSYQADQSEMCLNRLKDGKDFENLDTIYIQKGKLILPVLWRKDLRHLRVLYFENVWTDDSRLMLTIFQRFPRLQSLKFPDRVINQENSHLWIQNRLVHLEELKICNQWDASILFAQLLKSPDWQCQLPNLSLLSFINSKLNSQSIKALVKLPFSNRLRFLHLDNNAINDIGLRHLTIGRWHRLQLLSLRSNMITFRGFKHISTLMAPALTYLDLTKQKTWNEGRVEEFSFGGMPYFGQILKLVDHVEELVFNSPQKSGLNYKHFFQYPLTVAMKVETQLTLTSKISFFSVSSKPVQIKFNLGIYFDRQRDS